MKLSLVVLAVLFATALSASRDRNDKKYRVVCYWGSWSYYRPGDGMFEAEDSNPNICTHMIYGFAQLKSDNTIGIFDDNLDVGATNWDSGLDYGLGMYRRFNALRNVNKHLTTSLSIGGWNEGSDKYSRMVSNPSSRATFVDSVIKLLTKHDFDGLDVDWEYPGSKAEGEADREPGNPADIKNYVALLKELHDAFQPHGFTLSVATSAGKPTIDRGYDVPSVSKYVDYVNLMAYDYHGGWESHTGHDAPLHSHSNDTELDKEFTVEYAVDYWIKLGVDPKKLILGMGLYGRTFTLKDAKNFGIGAPAVGSGGPKGPLTDEVGMWGYNEICEFLKQGGWTVGRDDVAKVPFAAKGTEWVGYDDEQSLKDKIEFLKSKGLGGAMVWSIDTDDFRGKCGHGKYPLLKTISRELNGVDGPDVDIPRSSTVWPTGKTHPATHPTTHKATKHTARPHTDRTTKPTNEPTESVTDTDGPVTEPTTQPGGDFKCTGEGIFADPKDNTAFHECVNDGKGGFEDFVEHCAPGTVFDPDTKVCKAA